MRYAAQSNTRQNLFLGGERVWYFSGEKKKLKSLTDRSSKINFTSKQYKSNKNINTQTRSIYIYYNKKKFFFFIKNVL